MFKTSIPRITSMFGQGAGKQPASPSHADGRANGQARAGRTGRAGKAGRGKKVAYGAITRQTHASAPLILYSMVATLIAIGAFNSQNNLLFWMFGLALGMILVSGVLSGSMLMAIRVEREPIESPDCGDGLQVAYRITNTHRLLPCFALSITDMLEESPADATSGPGTSDSEGGANPEPQPAVARLDAAPSGFISYIPRRSTVVVSSAARTTARGTLRLAAVHLTSSFPFGIVRKSLTFRLPAAVTVLPARVTASGEQRSPAARGLLHAAQYNAEQGDEILTIREHQTRDGLSRIAWRATARTGELRTRVSSSAKSQRLVIGVCVDADAKPEAIEQTITAAADLVRRSLASRRAVGLVAQGPLGGALPARMGTRHIGACLELLAVLPREARGYFASGGDMVDATSATLRAEAGAGSSGGLGTASTGSQLLAAGLMALDAFTHAGRGGLRATDRPGSGGASVDPLAHHPDVILRATAGGMRISTPGGERPRSGREDGREVGHSYVEVGGEGAGGRTATERLITQPSAQEGGQ